MKERIWEDKDGNYLKIRPRTNGKAVRIEANVFDAADLRTLDEVITHLQWMRSVFGQDVSPEEAERITQERYEEFRDSILSLMTYGEGAVKDAAGIVSWFRSSRREGAKAAILFMGDSRRPDRELDLGRDDRTEAMMGEEERALMPSEVQDGRRVYYCTVQRRAK